MKNSVTKVLLMSVSRTLIVSQNLCLLKHLQSFTKGSVIKKCFENLKTKVANALSVTNCWACSQLKLGGMGFP
ncbi:hypothetical protein RLOC_00004693 [Lonchura striata]|uniref:Uncharacterized protein n=1 Tax=Lonchura striata TaxID=40157 RepID=A0A218UG90_9PASE|nr:hypothetical protein RLOC_00004693 [Lonchura striata domestica]